MTTNNFLISIQRKYPFLTSKMVQKTFHSSQLTLMNFQFAAKLSYHPRLALVSVHKLKWNSLNKNLFYWYLKHLSHNSRVSNDDTSWDERILLKVEDEKFHIFFLLSDILFSLITEWRLGIFMRTFSLWWRNKGKVFIFIEC